MGLAVRISDQCTYLGWNHADAASTTIQSSVSCAAFCTAPSTFRTGTLGADRLTLTKVWTDPESTAAGAVTWVSPQCLVAPTTERDSVLQATHRLELPTLAAGRRGPGIAALANNTELISDQWNPKLLADAAQFLASGVLDEACSTKRLAFQHPIAARFHLPTRGAGPIAHVPTTVTADFPSMPVVMGQGNLGIAAGTTGNEKLQVAVVSEESHELDGRR